MSKKYNGFKGSGYNNKPTNNHNKTLRKMISKAMESCFFKVKVKNKGEE